MNNLHKFLEDVVAVHPNGAIDVFSLKKVAKSAQCFYLGDPYEYKKESHIDESLCRLPYPICWFETALDNGRSVLRHGFLAIDSGNSNFDFHVFMTFSDTPGAWIWLGSYFACGDIKESEVTRKNGGEGCIENAYRKQLQRALMILNCSNVITIENLPPQKLQKKRMRNNKQPLFSYWTLHVKTSTSRIGDTTGSHASPRVHLRRGHYKKLKTGYHWWQPHAVGKKENGVVMKDYSLARAHGRY